MMNARTAAACVGALALLHSATGAVGQPAQYSYTFAAVATTATLIPEGIGTFSSFGPFFGAPVIDGANVAFVAEGANDQSGVYLFTGVGLARLADTGTPFPEPDREGIVSARFDRFSNESLSIDSAGVAFEAKGTITLGNGNEVPVFGIYISERVDTPAGVVRQLRAVAQKDYTYVPGIFGSTGILRSAQSPSLDSGAVAFLGEGDSNAFGAGHQGLYLESAGITVIADTFTLVPNSTLSNQTFHAFGPPSASGGHVAFRGMFGANLSSIYTTVGGLHAVTRSGVGAPDATGAFSGLLFHGVSYPVLDGVAVAFLATLQTSSGVFTGKEGVFTDAGGALHAVAMTGTAIPDGDATFETFEALSFSAGHVAFLATETGGGSALYSDLGGTLHRVVGVGDTLNGQTIVELRFHAEGLSGNTLAFFAEFGNGSSGIFTATREVIDTTEPVITATVTPTRNAQGWNNAPASVTWSVEDPDSGIAETTGCGPVTVTEDTSARLFGCSATNGAGLSAFWFTTVKLDTIAPTIAGSRNPPANASGWNNSDVTVSFICADDRSGVASCTGPEVVTTEGSNQPVGGVARDNADNVATATVDVNIDKVAPATTLSDLGFLPGSGWYDGPRFGRLSASDSGGSGVASITYRIGTGAPENRPGGFLSLPIFEEGTTTILFYASDTAGNVEPEQSRTIRVDHTPPVTTASASPGANIHGWNNTDVDVTLSSTDGVGSGVESIQHRLIDNRGPVILQVVTTPGDSTTVRVSIEGVITFGYSGKDLSGRIEPERQTTLRIDKTPPSFPFLSNVLLWEATGPDGATVFFSAVPEDSLSGIDHSPGSVVISHQNGTLFPIGTTAVTAQARDQAGNSVVRQFDVTVRDTTRPSLTLPPDFTGLEATSPLGRQVSYTASAVDTVDGNRPVTCSPATGSYFPIGTTTVTCTAQDTHGNVGTGSFTVHVQDTTAPTLSFGVPAPGANAAGWNNSDVSIGFTVADNGPLPLTPSLPTPLIFSTDGAGLTQTVIVTDRAGNSAAFTSRAVSVDKTAPVVIYTGNLGTYAVDQAVAIHCAASDNLSGVASTTCVDISGPASAFALGVNTYTAEATDRAGNVGYATTSLTVVVTYTSLGTLVTRFSSNGGVAAGLLAKLDAAANASNDSARQAQLQAFINQVNAQTGLAFTANQAEMLVRYAGALF